MGVSGNKRVSNTDYIPALLISFTKIKEFCEYFKFQKEKDKILSTIFNSLIDNNFLDGLVVEFKKLLLEKFHNIDNLKINEIIDFILTKLHEENNELKNNNISENNQSELEDNIHETQTYNDFIKYYELNKSIVQDLFYREDESISRCSQCKSNFYSFQLEKMLHFNMIKFKKIKKKDNLNLVDLIKIKEENKQKKSLCKKCKLTTNFLTITNFKKLPEIFIISFENIYINNILVYYLNMPFGNEDYILIGIIINKNENNEDVENYNVFFKDKFAINKWYIYDTAKKEKREVKEIKKICQNPLVCYYQKKITHIKIYVNKLYNQLNNLYNDLINLESKINKHIVDEKKFEKYYVVNKLWFNKLTKIFEEKEKYDNKIIFETFNDITNIHNLNNDQINNINNLLEERIKILINDEENENIFFPEFITNKETGIKYPKDFILISEKYLNDFLNEFNFDIKNKEKVLYEAICGENYIFIKDNQGDNKVYFVCYNLLFLLSVEKIFKFNEERYFEREINFYIKNKGLENYYEERKLDIDLKVQNIIDKEEENIGQLISVVDNQTMINLNKYFFNPDLKG